MQPLNLSFAPLASHPDWIGTLATWFEAEWPDYYGPQGQGHALRDLQAYAQTQALPFGLVATHNGAPCGFAAIKTERFATHPHLHPWVGAAVVPHDLRRRGIGAQLFAALEPHALRLGFAQLYSATRTAHTLLLRCGWQQIDTAVHQGEPIGIYQRTLKPAP